MVLSVVPIIVTTAMAVVMTIAVSTRVIVHVVSIGPVIVGVVAIMVVTITLAEIASMTVRTMAPTAFRRMKLLVRKVRVSLVAAELPLAILFLPDVIVQSDSLVKQRLIIGSICYR